MSTNQTLIDKLKTELVDAKLKYSQLQTELSTAENDGAKLRKLKESQSINFGEIVDDLITIVFETTTIEDGTEKKELESLQTFGDLVDKIATAVDRGQSFNVSFTFMNVEETERGKFWVNSGQNDKLKPLTGDKFGSSKIVFRKNGLASLTSRYLTD